jgi:transposase InsO family protein
MKRWIPQKLRDEIVEFALRYSKKTGLPLSRLIRWIGIGQDRFYQWRNRQGRPNGHNAPIPKSHWLEQWEREAIIAFYLEHQEDGYRRVAYMMIDADIAAASPSSVYRILKYAGLLNNSTNKESKKGKGFHQPSKPHKHWHIDVSHINIAGTFYYFSGIIDGYSRYIVHWEIREAMKEIDIEIILQRAREKFPDASPRIISDNGPQFISIEFKKYIRIMGMTHVRTSPYYPQSNGKMERFHQSLKVECIRPRTPVSLEDARKVVASYVDHYNDVRLHSGIGYIAPRDMLEGQAEKIQQEREQKLIAAQARRQANYRCLNPVNPNLINASI